MTFVPSILASYGGLHQLLLSLQTVGLVPQARLVMFHSADCFQDLYPISDRHCSCCRNGKGRACATNLSFKKVVSWQDIILENYAWYGPEDAEATKHHQKKCHGRSSERIKPALLSTCCCANSFNGCKLIHRLLQILLPKRPIFLPVETTRGWTEQLHHHKYRHEALSVHISS